MTPTTDYAKPATWNYCDTASIISLSIRSTTNVYVRWPPQVVIRLRQKYSRTNMLIQFYYSSFFYDAIHYLLLTSATNIRIYAVSFLNEFVRKRNNERHHIIQHRSFYSGSQITAHRSQRCVSHRTRIHLVHRSAFSCVQYSSCLFPIDSIYFQWT